MRNTLGAHVTGEPVDFYRDMLAARWLILELGRDWLNAKADRRTMSSAQVKEDVVHDFACFALTKGVRSARAAAVLVDGGFYEDALVATRTAYECYLHVAFILAQPSRVDDLVSARLGAYSGAYDIPLTKNGKRKWQTVIDPESGRTFSNGIPIPELAMGTNYPQDRGVHQQLYAFLSEHAHVHMVALGSYVTVDYERFVCEPSPSNPYSANLMLSYVAWLLVSELAASGEVDPFDPDEEAELDILRDALHEALEVEVDDPLSGLPEAMRLRLDRGWSASSEGA